MNATSRSHRGLTIAPRALLSLIVVLAAWALVVAVTGGVDLRPYGIPFRSTDSGRPAYAAVALIVVYVAVFRADTRRHLEWLKARLDPAFVAIERRAPVFAVAAGVVAFVLGMSRGAHVAGGSDSYGYISQADLWLAGDLVNEQPIAADVPWPDADSSFAPLAYRAAQEKGAIVPVYPPGLPLLMAFGKLLLGDCGPFVIVPLVGALMVWLTYSLGRLVWSPLLGIAASALIVTSPTFLYMLMNPMSDVPASAALLAAMLTTLSAWRSREFWTGFLASVAVLIRPNMAPLVAVFLIVLVVRAPARQRWRAATWFAIGALPGALGLAAINAHLYGAPWQVGYGSVGEYYSWAYFAQNITQYSWWLVSTETIFILFAFVPVALWRRLDDAHRMPMLFLAVFAAVVWVSYLFYLPFDVWWYLRFLLPAFPAMLVMAAVGLSLLLRGFTGPRYVAVLGVLIAVPLFALRISVIREEEILSLRRTGVVYATIAEYVDNALPPNAMILTVQHSGSIRHYSQRMTMRWDLLGREWWPRVFDVLVDRGYRPYLVISSFEEAQLRRQFGLSEAADAPGTVVAAMDLPESVRIYDPLREGVGAPRLIPVVVPGSCGPNTSDLDTDRRAWQPDGGHHASMGVRQWCDGRSADQQ